MYSNSRGDLVEKPLRTIVPFFRVSAFLNGSSRFRSNFLKIARANIIAQMIPLAFAPLLTRLYSPADFGAVAVFTAILGILGAFSTWRFDCSIPNAHSATEARALAVLGFMFLLVVSTASSLLFLFGKNSLASWLSFQALMPFLLLIPVALIGNGLRQLLQAWFIREGDLTALSKTVIAQQVTLTGMSVAGGALSLGTSCLITSSVISSWVGIGILFRHAGSLFGGIAGLDLVSVARAFKKFSKEASVSTAVSIVNVGSVVFIPIVLIKFYSATEIGWYALMYKVAIMPTGFITSALGQTFWSEASVLVRQRKLELKALYQKTAMRLSIIAVLTAFACLAGSKFVVQIFGEEWYMAGYVLLALVPWVTAQIIVQPITHLVVHNKQHWKLYSDGSQLAVSLGAIIILGSHGAPFVHVVFCISIAATIAYLILFILNLRCLSV